MRDRPIDEGRKDVSMNNNGNLIRVILAILLLATPAVSLRILSIYINAPYLQPLALTQEGLAAAGEGEDGGGFTRIDVHVGWGRDWNGGMTQDQLRNVIAVTLNPQTEFYHFEFDDQPGEKIDVTFVVGPNRYGPYPPGRMITGIRSALAALRLTNGPEG